jgi:hypothetical protein
MLISGGFPRSAGASRDRAGQHGGGPGEPWPAVLPAAWAPGTAGRRTQLAAHHYKRTLPEPEHAAGRDVRAGHRRPRYHRHPASGADRPVRGAFGGTRHTAPRLTAGQRAVIQGSSPSPAARRGPRWPSSAVYLCIATLGLDTRFCRQSGEAATRLPGSGVILILSGRYVSLTAAGAGQASFLASMTMHGGTVASSAVQAAGSRGRG